MPVDLWLGRWGCEDIWYLRRTESSFVSKEVFQPPYRWDPMVWQSIASLCCLVHSQFCSLSFWAKYLKKKYIYIYTHIHTYIHTHICIYTCIYIINIYISSEWLRTCERYPGVAKSYLIMRRTPPAQVPTHQVSDEIRNYVWFFLVRHGPLVKPWWHRNELAEIY